MNTASESYELYTKFFVGIRIIHFQLSETHF